MDEPVIKTVAYMMVNPYLPGYKQLRWDEPTDWDTSWIAVPLCLRADLEAFLAKLKKEE